MNKGGMGINVRDANEVVGLLEALFNVEFLEAMVVREGLPMGKELGFNKIIVKGDDKMTTEQLWKRR